MDLIQTYKILTEVDSVEKKHWFKTQEENGGRLTRQSDCPCNLVRLNVLRYEVRNNFFSQRVINSWSNLPDWIQMSSTLAQFKLNYNKFKGAGSGAELLLLREKQRVKPIQTGSLERFGQNLLEREKLGETWLSCQ